MRNSNKIIVFLIAFMFSIPLFAGFTVDLGNNDKITFGGYAKADIRHVSGDIAYQDYWIANFPGGKAVDTSHTGFNIKESRLNFKYQHDEVSAFVEMDFYGAGGNEVVSNSSNPRLRHFFIDYQNWKIGQTWTNFMPLAALPESLDFGGPHVGEVFIRQTQLRYTIGGFSVAIENPETNGDGDVGAPASAVGVTGTDADVDEDTPDLTAQYIFKGDWGLLAVGALIRKVDQGGLDETAVAGVFSGKINTFGKDDIRFQVATGETGRYTAPAMTTDIVVDPTTGKTVVEETTSFTVSYCHFWSDTIRSTIYYGAAETDVLERERAHYAINLLGDLNDKLTIGIELGNYSIDDKGMEGVDSDYIQLSAKFNL